LLLKKYYLQRLLLYDQTFIWFLQPDTNNVKNNYPNGVTRNYIQVSSMPSYNDKNGTVILLNNLQKIIDRLDYDEKWHFDLIDDKNGVSLERIDVNLPTNNSANWHSASSTVNYATPGYKNSQSGSIEGVSPLTIEPRTFSPDDDGFFDYTLLKYNFEKSGQVGTIIIYDANGRIVKQLVNGELFGLQGVYQWDGLNNEGEKANVGLYIILMEVFGLDGKIKRYRETVAIGGMK
jgi:hypothetical protein